MALEAVGCKKIWEEVGGIQNWGGVFRRVGKFSVTLPGSRLGWGIRCSFGMIVVVGINL